MDYGLFIYIQVCIFSRLKLLFNFYVKRTVRRQDFGAKFNLTFHKQIILCLLQPEVKTKYLFSDFYLLIQWQRIDWTE